MKKLDLVFSIEDAYWSLVKALDSLYVIEANVALTNEHLREVNDFYTHGLVTYNEVLSVELQLGNTSLLALDAENGIRIARERLSLLTGLPREAAFVPSDRPPEQLEAPGELPVLVKRALELRPEIAALQHRIQAGIADVALARSGWYPQLLLDGGYRYALPNPRIFPPEDRFSGSWEIGIILSVDFGKWDSIAPQEEQATAQVEQLHDALTGLRDSITLEVTRGYLEVTKYGKQTQVALQMIKQSEESERIVRNKYRNGLALTTDLLDAELSLLRAKLT
jgi:outer membrane protein